MAGGETGTVRLRRGRERALLGGHPWVLSGAVAGVAGDPAPGDLVRVEDSGGVFLAWGHFSPASRIIVRVLERSPAASIDGDWWAARLGESVARRSGADPGGGEASRLVFSEADFLPGLVVDRYADHLALQLHTPGAERMRAVTLARLRGLLSPAGIVDRSDDAHRAREGLEPVAGAGAGPPPGPVRIREDGLAFDVPLASGQKTGHYLDQRLNRAAVALWAGGRRVLDVFCYTGAFAVHAARGGAASLTLVDSSAEALAAAGAHLELNGLGSVPCERHRGNAFEVLRSLRDAGRAYDLVVLDPPALAPTRAQASKAARAYKDANLLALKLLSPGGILATFSCSGGVDPSFFREILRWAAADAGRGVQLLQVLGQPPDHPVRLGFPESEYLKGLVCRAP